MVYFTFTLKMVALGETSSAPVIWRLINPPAFIAVLANEVVEAVPVVQAKAEDKIFVPAVFGVAELLSSN